MLGASPVNPSSTLWGHTEVKPPAQRSLGGSWLVGGFAVAPEASAGCSPFPLMEFPSLPRPGPSLALLLSAQTPLWQAVL